MICRYYKITTLLFLLANIGSVFSQKRNKFSGSSGRVSINFQNVVNNKPLVLNDSTYINPFGESYTVKKFRYYISNIRLNSDKCSVKELNSYHLADEAKPASRMMTYLVKPGEYSSITFMVGVDSLHNVSGAQTGALDPLKDMFWTWNTGYVMAKFEGNSPVSTLQNKIFEYHIGGYKGINKVLQTLTLKFPEHEKLLVNNKHPLNLIILSDLNEWWKGAMDIKITNVPSITTPGNLAKRASENYAKMFRVQKISN